MHFRSSGGCAVPWLTSDIKTKIYNRAFLKKKAVKTGSTYFHNSYKKARNELNKLIKETKVKYYTHAIKPTKIQNPCEKL